MKLSKYLNKSIEERQSHIDLSEPCLLHPIKGRVLKMRVLREQHYEYAGIHEEDLDNLCNCHVCHLCDDPTCRNYYHTYLGTSKENFADRILQGGYRGIGESYHNGFFEIKVTKNDRIPKDFVKGRLPKTNQKVSGIRKANEIRNATDGKVNIQVRTALGETLPEGFEWGMTINRSSFLTCPHCGKEGGASNMRRYHFDNCKNFVESNSPQMTSCETL
jgi:hypothetical protein